MKKFLIIICILFTQINYCMAASSNNSFEIELREVPPGSPSTTHNGLSNGAVTAIALGSTAGGVGALSGLGYYLFKILTGLTCGFASDINCPYQLVNIDNADFITKSKHTYLIKAYTYASKDKNYKYLLIPDTNINPNTYNTIFFEIPEDFNGKPFQIIQASAPLLTRNNLPELDTDIFTTEKNATKLPTSTANTDLSKGVLIKQGKLTAKANSIMAITTSYKAQKKSQPPKTYAIIVVFE